MQVLRFDAYFKQTVHESPNEHYRLRDVRVFYYLEDDSISVVEPMVENRSTLSLSVLWLASVVRSSVSPMQWYSTGEADQETEDSLR